MKTIHREKDVKINDVYYYTLPSSRTIGVISDNNVSLDANSNIHFSLHMYTRFGRLIQFCARI